MDEVEALLILHHTNGLGSKNILHLIRHFGTAANALQASEMDWAEIFGGDKSGFEKLKHAEKEKIWKKDLEKANQSAVSLISYFDKSYPDSFKKLVNPPLFLYVKGEFLSQDVEGIGIVGTRQASIYGKEMAEKFAMTIAASGYTIISGLARGIDTAAHEAALKSGRTIAFIGSGLAQIYPAENTALVEKIAKQGAVISEFPMHAIPQKHHFPKRNRLICASSKALLLVEAPLKSGGMITMDLAHQQGKACFAIPGRIDIETFKGNHALIKSGKASLVDHPEDIVSIFAKNNLQKAKKSPCEIELPFFELEEEEKNLIANFPAQEITIDELAALSRLPIAKLSSLLMGLVLKQLVREFPGKVYKRVF